MLQLSSAAFQREARIPARFTCDGDNISPELSWKDSPAQTKSFVLIMHDPDAPMAGGFTHWVMYDIPGNVAHIEQNVPRQGRVAGTGIQGKNDSGKIGYMGPCPPSGTHRYYTRLYALDTELKLEPGVSQERVEQAMSGHVLEHAELMGKYSKASRKAA